MDWFFCGKTTSACYQQFLLRKLLLLTSVEVGFTMFATHGLLFHFSTGHVPPNFCPLLQSVRVWLLGSTSPAPSPISIPKHGTRKKWITWQVLFFNSFCFRNICFEKLPILNITDYIIFFFLFTNPHRNLTNPPLWMSATNHNNVIRICDLVTKEKSDSSYIMLHYTLY